jgi:type II secretory pathway component PulF
LRDGRPLSEALQSDPGLLPSSVVTAIRIGEQTGRLPQVLRDCAMRDTASLRNAQADGSIAALLSYYWVLTIVMLVILGGLQYWIVPKLKAIFTDFNIELPAITQRMITFADYFVDYWYWLPFWSLPVTLIILFAYGYQISWDRLNFPLFMRWFPRRDAPGVLRGLAWAVDARQPLPDLLTDAGEHHPRRDLGQRLMRIGQVMSAGDESWRSLADEGFVTGREVRALQAAERARHLPVALGALADSLDRARRHRLLWWIEWCKPLVILTFGWLVALYCAAFFLPIVELISHTYDN